MNKLIFLLISLIRFFCNCNSEIQTISPIKSILPSISNGNKQVDNNSLITMFATFGFNFQSGAKLYNDLFSDIDISNSTLLFNIKDSVEFKSFGGMNIAVGYVGLKDNIDNILNIIQSCIDYSYKNNVQTKLILINENKSIRNEVTAIVHSMISDLPAFPIELIAFHLNDPTQTKDDAVILTEIQDLIQSSMLSAKKEKLKDIHDRIDSLKALGTSMKKNDVLGSDSIQILQTLTEDFNDSVELSVKKMFSESMISTDATVNTTIGVLHSIIEDQLAKHYEKHKDIFSLHKNSDEIKAASYRSRLELSNALLPVYRSLIDSILQGSQEAFEKRMTRLPAVKRLPIMLKTLSENSLKSFLQNIVLIRSEFLKIITLETKVGLFSSEYSPISCKWIPSTSLQSLKSKLLSSKQSSIWWQTQYQNDLEIEKFKNYMSQRSEERVNTLFLGGSYNPYIRDSPFPPTHINLNYLIDPKSISMNSEYSQLYDEHKEGPCETRADPLIVPGVARFPFDPNQNPISTETTEPWWKLIKDFIFDEN